MKWIDVTSSKSEIVKKTAGLRTAQTARREGLFTVEGLRAVEELLMAEGFDTEYLMAEQALLEQNSALLHFLEQRLPADMRVYRVSADTFKKVSDTETPQGLLAVVKRKSCGISDVLRGPAPLICVLENLQDPGNMGTILRTADAAAASGVIALKGCVDFYGGKTVRSTMGSLLHLPAVQGTELRETVEALHRAGVRLYAAALGAGQYHYEADFSGPCAFLIGNEGNGLTEEALALADEKIMIPMPGRAESLNAAMAAGILMYEAVRQRITKK